MAWQSKEWGALPETGGLLDQPAGLLKKMSMASRTYDIFKARDKAPDVVGWIEDNPEAYEHYAKVKKLLKDNGY